MAWTFVRPLDPEVLSQRPLLDLGTGDGQTRAELVPDGFVVGVDRSTLLLRRGDVAALAERLPFRNDVFATVLAGDLFHHLDDPSLRRALAEIARVLDGDGRLVAWWLERTEDISPDAPRFTRTHDEMVSAVAETGLRAERLELRVAAANSPTAGLVATRR